MTPRPWWPALLLLCVAGCQCLVPTTECTGATCLPFEQWCAQRIPAERCANLKACGFAIDAGCEDVLPWPVYSTPEPCPALLIEAVDAGRVIYDEAAAARCLESLASSCRYSHPGCDQVLVGTVGTGEACRTGEECQPGTWCNLDACPGTCRTRQPAGDVVRTPEACATSSFEPLASGGFRCREFSQLGEACDANLLCAEGLTCGGDGGCLERADGGLRYPAAQGERCTPSLPGIGIVPCLRGLACHTDGGTEGVCGPLLAIGQRCSDGSGCTQNATCEGGLCVSLGGAGAPCSTAFDCLAGLACRNGSCGEKGMVGVPCGHDLDCRSELRCVERVCAVPRCLP